MARKASSTAKPAPGAPQAAEESVTLAQKYTTELEDLAAQARTDGAMTTRLAPYVKCFAVLSLLGVLSNASVLSLSPVYGGIPSGIYHTKILMAGCFVGWSGNVAFRDILPRGLRADQLLPVLVAYVPLVQFMLFRFSDKLGALYGPLLTECLTLFPVAAVTAAFVADELEGAGLPYVPSFIGDAAPGIGSWGVLKGAEVLSRQFLSRNVGKTFVLTRMGLEVLLSGLYAVLSPSKLLLLTAPAFLHTAVLNTHVMTPSATLALNTTLLDQEWMLLDRRESVTGYVSVIESLQRGFRVMRCDHSLLGGQWTVVQGIQVAEPIYGVFAMLEAVRLVDIVKVKDEDASALVVGLGIGTTPSALVTHGIDTTVVEIDPVVHEFAAKYFDLKENNPPVLVDAVSHTAGLVEQGKTYDYIIHDVFTGGAEPVDLFTLEFLQGLSDLLTPDGVVAINYAGDFSLPAPKIVVKTITTVFPTCRIFRESPAPVDLPLGQPDFTNMVIFCLKAPHDKLSFRPARVEDFLQSRSRQAFLQPQHEIFQSDFLGPEDKEILRKNDTRRMDEWHKTTAAGHWDIMRTVLPAQIWELW
ncbi:S-adenosyl-L-methionine-dependent methyltransferase [Emericellopsis atlantica]|uniref:S-adenosyl-L-methionine-dependent methyltransferase n=1 Tax=Emericellopsis atlantica TaxID=2614577 RepID=A0A9P8CKE3_9HYPO|nr:S-adenosyl-L-methionine-dependent methyltransferase [Emericellopsis atlantica]KAG9249957.1 S-adenosyl-L-methionine-dependent methyltransferase [Emericellopsis atlantica]